MNLQSLEEKWSNEASKEHEKKARRKNSAGSRGPEGCGPGPVGVKGPPEDGGKCDTCPRKHGCKQGQCEETGSKTEQVNAEQPQDGTNTFSDGDELEPVEATKVSMCSLCKSYVERGEAIVNAGDGWVHAACATNCGWPVVGNE